MAAAAQSVTKREIADYWKQKQMVEQDHFFAALKAAARVKARTLSDDDYLIFEDSLREYDESEEDVNSPKLSGKKDANNDLRIGIKDWWTKSKYAYLNEPPTKSANNFRRRSCTYVPQFFSYKSASPFISAYSYSRVYTT